jgi:hypothetical protein
MINNNIKNDVHSGEFKLPRATEQLFLPLQFSLDDCPRDFKQESQRNKKNRFSKRGRAKSSLS